LPAERSSLRISIDLVVRPDTTSAGDFAVSLAKTEIAPENTSMTAAVAAIFLIFS